MKKKEKLKEGERKNSKRSMNISDKEVNYQIGGISNSEIFAVAARKGGGNDYGTTRTTSFMCDWYDSNATPKSWSQTDVGHSSDMAMAI